MDGLPGREGVPFGRANHQGMTELTATRTLVKSPPELWAECSDAASLGRHLGQFGDIRITRLEPETAVAWEGELASGTVRLEPSGWGTRVVLTARSVEGAPVAETAATLEQAAATPEQAEAAPESEEAAPESEEAAPEPEEAAPEPEAAAPEPEAIQDPEVVESARRPGPFARLMKWLKGPPPPPPSPPEPASEEAPPVAEPVVEDPVAESPVEPPAPAEMPVAEAPDAGAAALEEALESLGQAHHRPFSRA
jgi:hypothetical protein